MLNWLKTRVFLYLTLHRAYLASLQRRVTVEKFLFDCAGGKRPLPNKEDCRKLALKLGGVWEGEL